MKIAIYGDSFACMNTKWEHGFVIGTDDKPSWVEIIEKDGHEITNFAVLGTSFMYSYEIFLKEHKNFDLNIFVVTSPTRIYVKELDGIRLFGHTHSDEEYTRIKKLPFYPKQQIHLDILKSVRVYLELWADWEMIKHVQHVLVKNLWNLSPNTIVIPGFFDSIEETPIGINNLAMHELSLLIKKEVDPRFHCLRKCHLSTENNIVLANLVNNAIEQKKKIVQLSLDDVVTPSNPNIDFYIRPSY